MVVLQPNRYDMNREQAALLLDALTCLWEEHYIGNKVMTDKLRELAAMLRKEYHIDKSEYEEF